MAGHGTPHRQPEQHSMSRLLELLSTSQDMIYGDNHLDRASETLDGTADHEMPSLSRQPSALRLFDSFSTSRLASQDTDLLADSEPVETQSVPSTSLLCSDSFPNGELQLERICLNEEQHFSELAFVLGYNGDTKEPTLNVTQREVHQHSPFGYTSRIHLIINRNEYTVNVLGNHFQSGSLQSEAHVHELCKMFSNQAPFKFCPGINWEHYEDHYHNVIRYHLKSVRFSTAPFKRVDSVNCKLWYKLPVNAPLADRFTREVMCSACKRLKNDLDWQRKRTLSESPSRKVKRQAPSSRAKLTYMSPASQSKRKQNSLIERNNDKIKLTKFEKTEITLAEEQHDEMCTIVNRIEEVGKDELEKVFADGDAHGVGAQIREVWMTDRRQQLDQFKADQIRNTTGKRSNQWSMVTIRIALAVYTRSPAAYEALKSFGILQLPSRSTLQSYTGAFLHDPGAYNHCIAGQVSQYILFKAECEKQGKHKPQGDGVLIFDEVKVACQLIWNSRSQTLSGLAMTSKDLSSLNDVYRILQQPDSPKQTSYILQFLWRDLTSNYDIVGPYFTCSESVDGKFIYACIFETLRLFQAHGLKTSLLVCDGCPANLTTIKTSHGFSGAYSVLPADSTGDQYAIKPWFVNPYNPPNLIYWMICPTHQLKNMINALFSSKSGGTKLFKRSKEHCNFGWDTIIHMYQREVGRAKLQQTRMVPRLKEVHCIRDAWTKLNVSPAKIMQQDQVLGELYWYIHQDPPPADAATTEETLQYLQACHKLFECGFLAHDKIVSLDSPVLKSIDEGYQYFTSWLSTLLTEDTNFPHTSSTQKAFLSWQTWDLLRIDIYGFRNFCQDFFAKYPGYFISPLRISGSAVESLFSQYKHNAGGKLDSCNYVTARCAHLVQQCAASHHSGTGYRDHTLSYMQLPLKKKVYGNLNT